MLRIVLLLPFIFLLIVFALSNTQPVTLGIWPTDFSVEVPVSLAILVASGLFFFLGALFVWFGTVAARTRQRRSERRARALEAELAAQNPPQTIVGRSRSASAAKPVVTLPAIAGPARR